MRLGNAAVGWHREVIAAFRTGVELFFDQTFEDRFAAGFAFQPQTVWDFGSAAAPLRRKRSRTMHALLGFRVPLLFVSCHFVS